MKESYVFYASFDEALRELPDKSRLKVYDAVSDYALRGIEPDLSGMEKAIFTLIKAQIDRRNQRVENGKKGGRKKQISPNDTQSEVKPHLNQDPSEVEPYFEQKEKVSPMEKESTKEKGITPERDKNLQESKKESYINKSISEGACAYEEVLSYEEELRRLSHDDILREWGVPNFLVNVIKDFLRHCYINGHIVSNSKLSDILCRLFDKFGSDYAGMSECVSMAIRGGYFDVKA